MNFSSNHQNLKRCCVSYLLTNDPNVFIPSISYIIYVRHKRVLQFIFYLMYTSNMPLIALAVFHLKILNTSMNSVTLTVPLLQTC